MKNWWPQRGLQHDGVTATSEQRGEAARLQLEVGSELARLQPQGAHPHLAHHEFDLERAAGLEQLLEAGDAARPVAGIERAAVGDLRPAQDLRAIGSRIQPGRPCASSAMKAGSAPRVTNSVTGRSSAAAALAMQSA